MQRYVMGGPGSDTMKARLRHHESVYASARNPPHQLLDGLDRHMFPLTTLRAPESISATLCPAGAAAVRDATSENEPKGSFTSETGRRS